MVKSVTQNHRVPSLFGELNELLSQMGWEENLAKRHFVPSLNLSETDHAYEVTLDLPGIDPDDVQVEIHEGQLSISGDRKFIGEAADKEKKWHRLESRFGKFRRTVALAEDVHAQQIEAKFKNGVLFVRVPKAPASQPRRIEIER